MRRFTLGVSIWTAGAVLLLYVAIVMIDGLESDRRTLAIIFEDNWQVTLPGLAMTVIGYRIMSRARL